MSDEIDLSPLLETINYVIYEHLRVWVLPKSWLFLSAEAEYVLQKFSTNFQQIQQDSESSVATRYNALLHLLDDVRYQYSVDVPTIRARIAFQNALIISLNYPEDNAKVVNEFSMAVLANQHPRSEDWPGLFQTREFEQFMVRRDVDYALGNRKINRSLVHIRARQNYIDGRLLDTFGFKTMLTIALRRISLELASLDKNKLFEGYLNESMIHNFQADIDDLSQLAATDDVEDTTLLQKARYLVDNVTETAGVAQNDQPRHKKHRRLIAACFWHDEQFKQAKVLLNIDSALV